MDASDKDGFDRKCHHECNNNRTVGRSDLSQNCNMKLMDAQRTIENKDILIKLLQDQLKKFEGMYKNNLSETEQIRYKYCVANDQLNQMEQENQKIPCRSLNQVEIRALQEGMLKLMKQQCAGNANVVAIKERLVELEEMIVEKHEELNDQIEKIADGQSSTRITHKTVISPRKDDTELKDEAVQVGQVAGRFLAPARAATEAPAEQSANVDPETDLPPNEMLPIESFSTIQSFSYAGSFVDDVNLMDQIRVARDSMVTQKFVPRIDSESQLREVEEINERPSMAETPVESQKVPKPRVSMDSNRDVFRRLTEEDRRSSLSSGGQKKRSVIFHDDLSPVKGLPDHSHVNRPAEGHDDTELKQEAVQVGQVAGKFLAPARAATEAPAEQSANVDPETDFPPNEMRPFESLGTIPSFSYAGSFIDDIDLMDQIRIARDSMATQNFVPRIDSESQLREVEEINERPSMAETPVESQKVPKPRVSIDINKDVFRRLTEEDRRSSLSSGGGGQKKRSVIFHGVHNDLLPVKGSLPDHSHVNRSAEGHPELATSDLQPIIGEFRKLQSDVDQLKSAVQNLEAASRNCERQIENVKHAWSSYSETTVLKFEENKSLTQELLKENLMVHSELRRIKQILEQLNRQGGEKIPEPKTGEKLSSSNPSSLESDVTIDRVFYQIGMLLDEDVRERNASLLIAGHDGSFRSASSFGFMTTTPSKDDASKGSEVTIQIRQKIEQILERISDAGGAGSVERVERVETKELSQHLENEHKDANCYENNADRPSTSPVTQSTVEPKSEHLVSSAEPKDGRSSNDTNSESFVPVSQSFARDDQIELPQNPTTTTRDEAYLQHYIVKVIEENGKLKTTINDLLRSVRGKIDELNRDEANAKVKSPSNEFCKSDLPPLPETIVPDCDNYEVVPGKFSTEAGKDESKEKMVVVDALENYILNLQKQLLITKKIEDDIQNLKETHNK